MLTVLVLVGCGSARRQSGVNYMPPVYEPPKVAAVSPVTGDTNSRSTRDVSPVVEKQARTRPAEVRKVGGLEMALVDVIPSKYAGGPVVAWVPESGHTTSGLLRVNDVLLSLAKVETPNSCAVKRLLASLPPEAVVPITLRRDNTIYTGHIRLTTGHGVEGCN